MESTLPVWIMKNVLTRGIIRDEVDYYPSSVLTPTKAINTGFEVSYQNEYFDWHRTEEDAIDYSEQERDAKITFFKKQIKKLENMSFSSESNGDKGQ